MGADDQGRSLLSPNRPLTPALSPKGERENPRACASRLAAAGVHEDGDAERVEPGLKISIMLLGENFSRRHQGHRESALNAHQGAAGRRHRFPATDVPLKQAAHRHFSAQIMAQLAQHAGLRVGQLKAELLEERFDQ